MNRAGIVFVLIDVFRVCTGKIEFRFCKTNRFTQILLFKSHDLRRVRSKELVFPERNAESVMRLFERMNSLTV